MEEIKKTCLHDRHVALGAQMSFPAGCDMAEHYVVTVGIYTSAAAFPAIHPAL